MAAKLEDLFGTKVECIRGSGGVFDVMIGDILVYSKAATGTFPDEDTLLETLKATYK